MAKPTSTHPTGPAPSRWVWRLGSVAGIPIRVHFTLLLLLIWIAWLELQQAGAQGLAPEGDPVAWLLFLGGRVLFIVGIFACVLFHEIGHALVARGFAIRTTEIMLYPFGGVARLHGMGRPTQELWISLAGPSVNIVIGLLLFAVLQATGLWAPIDRLARGEATVLQNLALANFILAGFNLIPAFPMDGGRVLRALLARRFGMLRGTSIAATIGQAFAIGLGLLGLFWGNFILIFIAFFVFVSASQEVGMQRSRVMMRGQHVRDAMIRRFESLSGHDSLGRAAEFLLATHQQDFPVVEAGKVIGVLTRPALVRGLTERGPSAPVSAAAAEAYLALEPGEPLQDAVEQLQAEKQKVGLVFDGAQLVGMLTEENVREFFQLHAIDSGHG
ncbi:MAG: CBS domain-containing protein [Candidatus Eisenbacteria bacterium]|nr:CBS domain-containing protein [Candidatus Eisenbacteria bacterium]